MRTLLAAFSLAGFMAIATADEPKNAQDKKDPPKVQPKKAEPTLKVGDDAPKLKASKWMHGTEVNEFASGKMYVVEFWATWCGPCIVMMPHMSELQREFAEKGVVIIGYSAKDPNNTQEKVAAFVEKRGAKLGYTFAYGDDRETYDAWMKAAGQNGIPCSYVVDRKGKIAYIGHPMFLDVVLPKVVDGTWTKDDITKLDTVEEDVNTVFKSLNTPNAADGLKALADFETKYPRMAHIPYFMGPKLNMLLKAKKFDEAKAMAKDVVARAVKVDDPLPLRTVSALFRSPVVEGNKEFLEISLKAAESFLKVAGEKDALALINLADTHFSMGDKAKAVEIAKKAIEAAEKENPNLKRFIETQAKKFEEEKKEEKKDK